MVVSSPVVPTEHHLRYLFPDVAWSQHLRSLKRHKLITDDVRIEVSKNVENSFVDEHTDLQSRWQARVKELHDHIDCDLFLSVIYLRQKRIEDGLQLVIDMVFTENSFGWFTWK